MPTDTEIDEPIDGRTARAVRTRDAIVDACIGLIDEGDLRPTGPRIAERAGVSVRSIFQHFDDLDALFSAVGARVSERITGLLRPIDVQASLAERTDQLVEQRTEMLEALTPVLRAALVHAASSTVIRQQFDDGYRFFVAQIDEVFAPEIASPSGSDVLRDALVVALSWTAWDQLRGAQGRSVEDARRIIGWMVHAVLDAAIGS